MTPLLAALDYSVFPPVNAALNSLSALLLVAGLAFIKSGNRKAHQTAMISALVSSTLFLACYLVYHYGTGHTEFPKEYPVAKKIYLAILIPHIILAVVNLPFIVLLVVAAARGRFERHKRLARYTFPSWLFVSVTGVVIYFMLYHWYPAAPVSAPASPAPATDATATPDSQRRDGALVFSPASQTVNADPGQKSVEVLYRVENTGTEPEEIVKLESGCECLAVEIDVNPIPANGTATIKGVFDIGKLRGSTERKISVTAKGRARPLFLAAHIEIDPVYEIDKAMTVWEKGSDPVTKTVTFRVVRKSPVHILGAESKRPEVRCEVEEVEKGRLYRLALTPQSTEKTLLGIVRIETDCEIESYARPLAYYSIQ